MRLRGKIRALPLGGAVIITEKVLFCPPVSQLVSSRHSWWADTQRRSELLRGGQDRLLPPSLLSFHSSAVSTAKLIFQSLLYDIWLTEQRCRGQPSVGREAEQVEGGQKGGVGVRGAKSERVSELEGSEAKEEEEEGVVVVVEGGLSHSPLSQRSALFKMSLFYEAPQFA